MTNDNQLSLHKRQRYLQDHRLYFSYHIDSMFHNNSPRFILKILSVLYCLQLSYLRAVPISFTKDLVNKAREMRSQENVNCTTVFPYERPELDGLSPRDCRLVCETAAETENFLPGMKCVAYEYNIEATSSCTLYTGFVTSRRRSRRRRLSMPFKELCTAQYHRKLMCIHEVYLNETVENVDYDFCLDQCRHPDCRGFMYDHMALKCVHYVDKDPDIDCNLARLYN